MKGEGKSGEMTSYRFRKSYIKLYKIYFLHKRVYMSVLTQNKLPILVRQGVCKDREIIFDFNRGGIRQNPIKRADLCDLVSVDFDHCEGRTKG